MVDFTSELRNATHPQPDPAKVDIRDRIAAKRAAAKAAALNTAVPTEANAQSAPTDGPIGAAPSTSRAQRFAGAGLTVSTEEAHGGAGLASEAGANAAAANPPVLSRTTAAPLQNATRTDDPTRRSRTAAGVTARPAASPAAAAASTAPRVAGTAVVSALRHAHEQPKLVWADPARPPGSGYSEEEWAAAELANPGCTVMEMLKPQERALVAMPTPDPLPSHMADLLRRSLVIHDLVNSDWAAALASAKIEHHGAFGRFTYLVVRCQREREKNSWLDGATMTLRDTEAPSPTEEQVRAQSRSQRYRAT
jgi:hypothetical protein